MMLRVELGRHTDRILRAGERIGRALESDARRPWWKGLDDKARVDLMAAHYDAEVAFNELYEWLADRGAK